MTIVPFPNNFDIYFQNAMDALMSGNFEEAVAFIDKALAIKMDDELFNIGVSLLQSQNQAENALCLITKYQCRRDGFITHNAFNRCRQIF